MLNEKDKKVDEFWIDRRFGRAPILRISTAVGGFTCA